MKRLMMILVVALCGLGVMACDSKKEDAKAAEAEAPKDRGNLKEGRPAVSTMGKRVESAKKVQGILDDRQKKMDDEMPK